MNNFYSSHLMGGLGNQMFQISHAICQGFRNNVPTVFNPIASISTQGNQTSLYINNVFRNVSFENNLIDFEIINEGDFRYNFNFKNIKPPKDRSVKFLGYFQSSKNFFGFDDEIKKIFDINETTLEKISSLYPTINNPNTLSIHVRRGDYLNIPNVLPTLDIGYYLKCIDSLPESTIFIFTDDKNWVKSNFSGINYTLVENLYDYEDLWMMSLCKNNILSNSSFSWWGGFLNKNGDKKVMCPSTWFGPNGPVFYNDIYESHWDKINVRYNKGKLICY